MSKRCTATTKAGAPCPNRARTDLRLNVCLSHAPKEIRESRGFGGAQAGSGRPRVERPTEILQRRLEETIQANLDKIMDGLVGQLDANLHASYQGDVVVSSAADAGARHAAALNLIERVIGKPLQPVEHAGSVGLRLAPPTPDELAAYTPPEETHP